MSVTHSTATRRACSRTLSSAVLDNLDALTHTLEPLLFPDGVPRELDVPTLLRALAELLERDVDALETCEHVPVSAAGNGRELASQRDHAVHALRHELLGMRNLFVTVYGPLAPARYGLDRRPPETPEELLVFARHAVAALERNMHEPQPTAAFISVDLAGAIAALCNHIDRLDMLLHADDSKRQHIQAPCERASRTWNRHYQAVASITEAILRLASIEDGADLAQPPIPARTPLASQSPHASKRAMGA